MLSKYYSFDECSDIPSVIRELKRLEKMGAISYVYDKINDILTLEDLDLSDDDVDDLIEFFEEYNVLINTEGTTDDSYFKDDMGDSDDYTDFHSHY